MATTRREAVLVALQTLLSGLADVDVVRNPPAPVDTTQLAGARLDVFDGPHSSSIDEFGVNRHRMEIEIVATLRVEDPERAGSDVNALYGRVMQLLNANWTLDGNALDVREAEFVPDLPSPDDATSSAGFSLSLDVEFTTTADPYTA